MNRDEVYDLEDISEYTSSVSDSTDPLSSSVESNNQERNQMLEDLFPSDRVDKPKRGRRPLRPYDPIRKKTEEKDKYWLRAFRSHIRKVMEENQTHFDREELEFWEFYLGPNGKPGKGHKFLSYGKKYKSFLFANHFFVLRFREWFDLNGEMLLAKKYEPGTAEWFVFYDYAARDLYYYSQPTGRSQIVTNEVKNTINAPEDEFLIDEQMGNVDNIL